MINIGSNKISNVYALNGYDENSATFALGWALDKCPRFSREFLGCIINEKINDTENIIINLQKFGTDKGFSDIEIEIPTKLHVIIEAKKLWTMPSEEQIKRYVPRLVGSNAKLKLLLTISAASRSSSLVRKTLALNSIDNIPVKHLSWNDLENICLRSILIIKGFEEKLWLHHFVEHLKEYKLMSKTNDNNVFVVSISNEEMIPNQKYSWRDVVNENMYFHPVGNRWPVEPPNYIAFRYSGRLQTIHHINEFKVVENLNSVNKLWPETTESHFVYQLGIPITPKHEMKTGNLYRNQRVYCAIDTLISGEFSTIREARDETQRRLNSENISR